MRTASGERASPAPAPRGAAVVLYDGVCALCNGTVRFTLARDRDRRFRFAPLQGPFAHRVLARHGHDAGDLDTMCLLVDCDEPTERLLVRSEAVVYLLGTLGGVWKLLARLAALVPRALRDRAYGLVVRDRYRWFGRYDVCPVPDPEARDRFIDLASPLLRGEGGVR